MPRKVRYINFVGFRYRYCQSSRLYQGISTERGVVRIATCDKAITIHFNGLFVDGSLHNNGLKFKLNQKLSEAPRIGGEGAQRQVSTEFQAKEHNGRNANGGQPCPPPLPLPLVPAGRYPSPLQSPANLRLPDHLHPCPCSVD
eukprot:401956-Rhodomonas_salina.1